MKNFIKSSAKILFDYAMVLIVFAIFIYVFMSITKDNFNTWLPYYCLLIFILAFYIIYTDMKNLAIKEKKPQYELNPYPLKGLIYGLAGTLPIALITAAAALVSLGNETAERIKHLAINVFLGPMYFLIRWMNETPLGYAAAILLLPLISMLGYLAGHYGINILDKLRKKKQVPVEKGFTKSPWNPSNTSVKGSGKKKNKVKKTPGGN